jgi:hypothetical protein
VVQKESVLQYVVLERGPAHKQHVGFEDGCEGGGGCAIGGVRSAVRLQVEAGLCVAVGWEHTLAVCLLPALLRRGGGGTAALQPGCHATTVD